MSMLGFWIVMPCGIVGGLKMEAVYSSKMLVSTNIHMASQSRRQTSKTYTNLIPCDYFKMVCDPGA
jgi:hypothetical protein